MSNTMGMPEPYTETGHSTKVEGDRNRVVCLECPWFHYDPALTVEKLRTRGYDHKSATKLR